MSLTSAKSDLPDRILERLRRAGVKKGSALLVAVSGGADSTALLDALSQLENLQLRIAAVHVWHGIRSDHDGDLDVRFLEAFTRDRGVELRVVHTASGEIARTAAAQGRSLEEVARGVRYSAIMQTAMELSSEWIATAHTRDDQLETVLIRVLQGGHLQGLGGIPRRRDRIIRPLLNSSRAEILGYLTSRGIEYRHDSTNDDESYMRNRVRRRLIPIVKELFPGAPEAIQGFADDAADLNKLISACASLLIPWRTDEDGTHVSAAEFFRAPPEIRKRSILRLYNEAGVAERIPAGFLNPLESVSQRRAGGRLLEGHGAVLEQKGEMVFWRSDVVLKTKKSYLIRVFGPSVYHITPTLRFSVSTEPIGSARGQGIGLPHSSIKPPLVVRSRKPGDAIQMKNGTKLLKKLFNEWGVNEAFRDGIPVIEDRNGILAVAGNVMGYKNRIREGLDLINRSVPSEREFVFAFESSGEKL